MLAAALYTSTAIVTTFFYKGEKPATLLHFLEFVPGATCLLASLYIVCGQAAGKVLLRPGAVGLLQNLVLRCGTLTYAIYVLHGPLLQVLRDALKPPFPSPLSLSSSFGWFPVALVAIWLSAELAYRFVEEPVERRKHVPGTALTDAP